MRPTKDRYWMNLLSGVSARASCPRRSTAALIVSDSNTLLASGYNGPPSGMDNCLDVPCEGVGDKSGNTDRCIAVHAEQNAILQAGDRLLRAEVIYCSTYPCFVCAKLICQTPIKRVVYDEDYPDERSKKLFKQAGIKVEHIERTIVEFPKETEKSHKERIIRADKIDLVFSHWKTTLNHPKAQLDAKRRAKISKALETYDVVELKHAINGVKNSPWHMGDNPTSTIYDKIDLIFRDADHIERFIELSKVKTEVPKNKSNGQCMFCKEYELNPKLRPCKYHQKDLYETFMRKYDKTEKDLSHSNSQAGTHRGSG